jgi:photosystem II stability/assembly factor-like uncharacterized protein
MKTWWNILTILALVFTVMSCFTANLRISVKSLASGGNIATGITSIYFIDDNIGWAVGWAGIILNTNDSGLNWKVCEWQYSGDIYCVLNDVKFVDVDNGWIVGRAKIGDLLHGIVMHTSDGGATWEIQMEWREGGEYGWYELYGVDFINPMQGWVVGEYNTIFHTDYGGLNWTHQLYGGAYTIYDIKFINENIGWACGSCGRIWRTLNGGLGWGSTDSPTFGTLYKLDFSDLEDIWCISSFGDVVYSEDGGFTWTLKKTDLGCLQGLDFINSTHGWVVNTGGEIYNTEDGGYSWSLIKSSGRDWRDLCVLTSEPYIYAVGGTWQTAFGESNCLLAVIEKSDSDWKIQIAPSMSYEADINGTKDYVTMEADSTLTQFTYNYKTNEIRFNVFGPNGFTGKCNVTIPKTVLAGKFDVYIDSTKTDYKLTENATHYLVQITYTHSTHDIQIKARPPVINGGRFVARPT